MDIFAYNLQNHAHYTKLNAAKQNTTSGYRPALLNNNTSALIPQNDLINLNAVKFSSYNNGLPNNIQRHYIDNRLCIVYGQPGY